MNSGLAKITIHVVAHILNQRYDLIGGWGLMHRVIHHPASLQVYGARAEAPRTVIDVVYREILQAEQRLRCQRESRRYRCGNEFLNLVKLKKGVPRFERRLLLRSVEKLMRGARHEDSYRLLL